jgi:hypothetical protein
MTMRTTLVVVGVLALTLAAAVAKDHAWQIGKIADLQADQQPTTGKVLNRVTVKESEVRITGKEYEYLVYDSTSPETGLASRAVANRKHGCRFIVNDDVKYVQTKNKLYVIDADGKECKLDILRQERLVPNP